MITYFNTIGRIIFYLCCVILLHTSQDLGQTTPQPTPPPGYTNSVTFDGMTYKFYYNGNVLYEYSVLDDGSLGGFLNALRVRVDPNTTFTPGLGGITIKKEAVEIYAPSGNVNFSLLNKQILRGDTVFTYWQMAAKSDPTLFCKYSYKMKIVGRTLVLKVLADSIDANSLNVTKFDMDRCEYASNATIIGIPYLNLVNVLSSNNVTPSNGVFTSFFFDWEVTNASQLFPASYTVSGTSVGFSQSAVYNLKTDQTRNRLRETIYLTMSPKLEDVLPNIPNPIAPYKDVSAKSVLWDFREPFGQLVNSPWSFLNRVKGAGVKNIWLQIHDWQKDGYDVNYPCVTPADSSNPYIGYGGNTVLNSVINAATNYGYRVGLHENYVDMYVGATCSYNYGYNDAKIARNGDGSRVQSYLQSYLLKPSQVLDYANHWSNDIQNNNFPGLSGSYLDVHSSTNPSYKIDYDASVTNSGMFRETLRNYRGIYDILRGNHHGPVQGEGGFHFLYIGYVDDVEARLQTAKDNRSGRNNPLLLNFDLLRLHSKTMVHGVGCYCSQFFSTEGPFPKDSVLFYIATELAFGHGGYLPHPGADSTSNFGVFQHAQLEENFVHSVQSDYANANVVKIEYYHNGDQMHPLSISEYLNAYPKTYDDPNSNDFMSQVKVTYDNGVIVCVNRHPSTPLAVSIGLSNQWFCYNVNTLGLGSGIVTTPSFTLPARCGWVVYDPLKTSSNTNGTD